MEKVKAEITDLFELTQEYNQKTFHAVIKLNDKTKLHLGDVEIRQ